VKVYVNNHEVEIFRGARVNDAVRSYSMRSSRKLLKDHLKVIDRYGNTTEPDGELSEGQQLYLKKR
jgi:hypothetical protein